MTAVSPANSLQTDVMVPISVGQEPCRSNEAMEEPTEGAKAISIELLDRMSRSEKLSLSSSLAFLNKIPTSGGDATYFISCLIDASKAPKTASQCWSDVVKQQIYLGRLPQKYSIFIHNLKIICGYGLMEPVEVENDNSNSNGKVYYAPTDLGREIAATVQKREKVFQNLFSIKSVVGTTISIHLVFAILKLTIGVLSKSSALFADGVDECGDGLASIIVGLFVALGLEKLSTIIILILMVVSAVMIGFAAAEKIITPVLIGNAETVLGLSIGAAVVLGGLGIYQNAVGRRRQNFSLIAMSIDSRNHVLTSGLVCFGVVMSMVVQAGGPQWLLYVDAGVSIFIGLVIVYTIFDTAIEFLKPPVEEGSSKKHLHMYYVKWARRRALRYLVYSIFQDYETNNLDRDGCELDFALGTMDGEIHASASEVQLPHSYSISSTSADQDLEDASGSVDAKKRRYHKTLTLHDIRSFILANIGTHNTPILSFMQLQSDLFENLFSVDVLKVVFRRLVQKKLLIPSESLDGDTAYRLNWAKMKNTANRHEDEISLVD